MKKSKDQFSKCPHCNEEIIINQKFCHNCGNEIEWIYPEDKYKCKVCSIKNKTGSKYCKECGSRLGNISEKKFGVENNLNSNYDPIFKKAFWLSMIPITSPFGFCFTIYAILKAKKNDIKVGAMGWTALIVSFIQISYIFSYIVVSLYNVSVQ